MKGLRGTVRIAFACLLGIAGWLKLTSSEGVAVEVLRLFGLQGTYWKVAERSVQAVGVLELAVGLAMLSLPSSRNWILALTCLLLGFVVWDVGRFVTGGDVDCGCIGTIKLATTWAHVGLKHIVLVAGWALLARPSAFSQGRA
jgi:methylamine utilization protein MauE